MSFFTIKQGHLFSKNRLWLDVCARTIVSNVGGGIITETSHLRLNGRFRPETASGERHQFGIVLPTFPWQHASIIFPLWLNTSVNLTVTRLGDIDVRPQ
jgi:hypothetical protein